MISRALLATRLHPYPLTMFNQFRYRRPTLVIGKEKFQLSVDLHQFNKDEIKVKSNPNFLIIEGKHEKQTKDGDIYVVRQFVRKFKLPEGTVLEQIRSCLSSEGILTVTAPRELDDDDPDEESEVPITYAGSVEEAARETDAMDKSETKNEEKDDKTLIKT